MEYLWGKGRWKKASYPTLEWEFIQFFQTNDKRTIIKYLGRPQQTVRYSAGNVVRMNRSSGELAQFEYHNTRKLDRKRGLLEKLGYVTDLGNGDFKLNHEFFPYYTEQVSLEPSSNSRSECERVTQEASIDNLCVSSIEAEENSEASSDAGVLLDGDRIERKKEEEVIEGTHANPYLYPNMLRGLSPEEKRLFRIFQKVAKDG